MGFIAGMFGLLIALAIIALLFIAGILVLLLVVKTFVLFLPSILIALGVYLLTRDLGIAALTFLAVTLLWLISKIL